MKKQNKALTVLFSFLPGAGHMFMGFMKRGLSFMSLFFLIIFFASWLNISPILYLMPILWFYAFFDSINIAWMDDSAFSGLQDNYIFKMRNISNAETFLFGCGSRYDGILLVILGVFLLLNNIMPYFYYALQPAAVRLLRTAATMFPQILLSVVIIFIGVRLIIGKKKELEKDD